MKKDAGCDENMNDDEEERRENEGVHGRVVDDERKEKHDSDWVAFVHIVGFDPGKCLKRRSRPRFIRLRSMK